LGIKSIPRGMILIVVVMASIFGVSYALARYLHGVRERLIKNTVREVEEGLERLELDFYGAFHDYYSVSFFDEAYEVSWFELQLFSYF